MRSKATDSCSITLLLGFVMLRHLFLFLICFTMIMYGYAFTVLGLVATDQFARASQCCYQATCLTPQTNVDKNQ